MKRKAQPNISEDVLKGKYINKNYTESEFLRDSSRIIAFYLPQYHQISENSKWWSPGFTDWVNVAKARPLFMGHYQPHIPRELGFYDLSNVDVIREQTRIAREFGLHGFCFYWYWFDGRRVLEKPLDLFLHSDIDFPFCICWANESWSRTWDGHSGEILIEQKYTNNFEIDFVTDLLPYIEDPRYIKVLDRPLILIYRAHSLPDTKNSIKRLREEIQVRLGVNPYIAAIDFYDVENSDSLGVDALVEFPPHKFWSTATKMDPYPAMDHPFSGAIIDYKKVILQSVTRDKDFVNRETVLRGLVPGWDNTARKKDSPVIFQGSTPQLFKTWLQALRQLTRESTTKPEEKLIFVNAWNEWAEGAHLEPDLATGWDYLNAIKTSEYYSSDMDLASREFIESKIGMQNSSTDFNSSFDNHNYKQRHPLLGKSSQIIFIVSPVLHRRIVGLVKRIQRFIFWA